MDIYYEISYQDLRSLVWENIVVVLFLNWCQSLVSVHNWSEAKMGSSKVEIRDENMLLIDSKTGVGYTI